MSKGSRTREAILSEAVELAAVSGLSGVTIGTLASLTGMSKSGLFGHFGSKEALQIDTLGAAADQFAEVVVRPALQEPAGIPRIRALFDRWIQWSVRFHADGGCLFVAASIELDDQPGPTRDFLVEKQREWVDVLARSAARAVEVGAFRSNLDPDQFAYELHCVYLGFHHARRLLRDPHAEKRARAAFESLIERARRS